MWWKDEDKDRVCRKDGKVREVKRRRSMKHSNKKEEKAKEPRGGEQKTQMVFY